MDAAVAVLPGRSRRAAGQGPARQRAAGPAAMRLRARPSAGWRPRCGSTASLTTPRESPAALQVLGSVAREQGRYARSMELHAESLAVAEAAGDRWASRARTATWASRPGCSATSTGRPRNAPWRSRESASSATWRESPGRCSAWARSRDTRERRSGPPRCCGEPALVGEDRVPRGHRLVAEQLGLLGGRPRRPGSRGAAAAQPRAPSRAAGPVADCSVLEDLAALAWPAASARAGGAAAGRGAGAAGRYRHGRGAVESAQHEQTLAGAGRRWVSDAIRRRLAAGPAGQADALAPTELLAGPPAGARGSARTARRQRPAARPARLAGEPRGGAARRPPAGEPRRRRSSGGQPAGDAGTLRDQGARCRDRAARERPR